jgi:hypothetical protein
LFYPNTYRHITKGLIFKHNNPSGFILRSDLYKLACDCGYQHDTVL